ncbi:MAG: rhodanese-like domain-containing protein [Pseudonocardia sp.]|nr:rhodanese-like domain-containing protein [Pseudonocardia sp.]
MTVTTPPSARLDVTALRAALAAEPDTLLVDIRSPDEFRAAGIDGAVNIPLDRLDAHLRRIVHDAGGRMVLVCQSGARAARAAERLGRAGLTDVVVLEGGMNAWVAANAPVCRFPGAAWSLERQVRLVAGGIVASSVLASVRAPRLRFVAGAVGLGLVTAAVTDTCGLARLLARLPWNRSNTIDIDAEIDAAVARLRGGAVD